ncbi:hypothetical protein F5B21DRAFT_350715 [Xylaria acuta]|nr:hypothetical protein F5B21DRAFT_350715 [Xylaria acuta]
MAGRDAIDSDLVNPRKRKRLLNTASTRYDRDNSESGESSLFVADEDGGGGDVMIVDRSPPEATETGSPDLLCCLCGEEKPSKNFTSQFPEPVCTDCEPLSDLS